MGIAPRAWTVQAQSKPERQSDVHKRFMWQHLLLWTTKQDSGPPSQCRAARHGTAQHSTAQHRSAWDCMPHQMKRQLTGGTVGVPAASEPHHMQPAWQLLRQLPGPGAGPRGPWAALVPGHGRRVLPPSQHSSVAPERWPPCLQSSATAAATRCPVNRKMSSAMYPLVWTPLWRQNQLWHDMVACPAGCGTRVYQGATPVW